MRTLAIIPCRAGSKGIPDKNMAPCGGRPLLGWTLEAAKGAQRVRHIIVSTDSEAMMEYANSEPYKVRSFGRPPELAQDETPLEPVLAHVLDTWSLRHADLPLDAVVLLQPTSPLRTAAHVDAALELLEDSGYDSVVSVVPSHSLLWHWNEESKQVGCNYNPTHHPNRQQMGDIFEENGAIYAFTMRFWQRTRVRLGGDVCLYPMSEEHRLQVDSPFDLWMCEQVLTRRTVHASS